MALKSPPQITAARVSGSLQIDLPSLKLGKIKVHTKYLLLILVLLAGIAVRVYNYSNNPPGLNLDEASAGYDSYSIVNYGIDRNAQSYPVHLIAWGSGQNALYAYIVAPFIKIFGLSPVTSRIGNLIFGVISLLLMFFIARKVAGFGVALIATSIFAVSPWGIMISRWGLPENVFPAIMTIGVYLFMLSFEKPRYLPASFAVFALSLYAYGTGYFVVPLFMLLVGIWVFRSIKQKTLFIRNLNLALTVFIIVSIPILLFVVINIFASSLSEFHLGFLTIPKLTTPGARYAQVVFLNRGLGSFSGLAAKIGKYIGYYYDTVFGQKGAIWSVINNQSYKFGTMYLVSNFFFLIGFIVAVIKLSGKAGRKTQSYLIIPMAWFILSSILGIISETNTNRINIIFIPMMFFVAYGIYNIVHLVGLACSWAIKSFEDRRYVYSATRITALLVIGIIYLSSFVSFCDYYFNPKFYPDHIGHYFHESFDRAIKYADSINHENKTVYIANFEQAYIYVLYYLQIDPREFIKTVVYDNPYSSFRKVRSFANYRFVNLANYDYSESKFDSHCSK